jgi:hypothetical protein
MTLLTPEAYAVIEGRHSDPFRYLGPHAENGSAIVRVFLPDAEGVAVMSRYRKNVPREPWYAAALVGALAEDCGPCTQLGITMAEREGVAADTLRAIVAGDLRAMPDDVVLAYRFAKASLAHDAAADELRDKIVKRWGPRGLISLAFALACSRVYPTVKYALGHGKACTRLTVAGKPLPVLKEAA